MATKQDGRGVTEILARLKGIPDHEIEERCKRGEESINATNKDIQDRIIKVQKRSNTSLELDDIEGKTWETLNPKQTPENRESIAKCKVWRPDMDFGLLLYGGVGLGKTHIAKAIINKWASETYRCKFIASNDIPEVIKKGFEQSGYAMEFFCAPDLLVIDDLGKDPEKEWSINKLIDVFDRRRSLKKQTIVTSNLDGEQIFNQYGARMTERIRENLVPLAFKGESQRLGIMRAHMKTLDGALEDAKRLIGR